MKKVAMIIAQDQFRDEEFFQPKEILEKNGIAVKVASTTLNSIRGSLGAKAKADILAQDVDVDSFDAFVFVGGAGAQQYWDDPWAHELAQEAVSKKKILAAICIAPVTLARAGILKGKRATVWPAQAGELTRDGANYTAQDVVKDGDIITASGPAAAKKFAEQLVEALAAR